MSNESLINSTVQYVKDTLENAEGGHDWWHIFRVWKMAQTIAASENADMLVVELAALLHDIADSKFHNGDEAIGPKTARAFLKKENVDTATIDHVVNIIENISFKGGTTQRTFHSLELDIVQDADRLDAVGAIGIARAFNYGGFKNRKIYDPNIPPVLQRSREDYKSNTAPTINHFHEKLFLLKDLMNTNTGKQIAQKRHQFMENYIDTFYKEWDGVL
ncbi:MULTISPECIES: HD domain-containing protein [Chitinophagaceae]